MVSLTLSLVLAATPCLPSRDLVAPVRGVVLSLHDADARRSYRADVEAIRDLGANAISIMPTWHMPDVRAGRVVPGNSTLSQLEEALAVAREHGLAVLVAPVLQIEQLAPGEWRGVLNPPDWAVWFESYRDLMVEVAELAERHEVAALLVGSELCSTEKFAGRWHNLIADVRTRFHGSIAYQANWDHREVPSFLDALDGLASNAYFELAADGELPTVEGLVSAWAPFRKELLDWSARHRKPLILTEVGYPSLVGGVAHPWDYTQAKSVDLEGQRRAYEAFFRAWSGPPSAAGEVTGYFLYEWWGAGGVEDRGYTPRGKPAEAVVRDWFSR